MATTVNISSYAGGVVGTDWKTPFQNAFAAIQATGGTINLDTDTQVESLTNLIPTDTAKLVSMNLKGDAGTKLRFKGSTSVSLLNFGAMNNLLIEDIQFYGSSYTSGTIPVDAAQAIAQSGVTRATVRNCVFVGVETSTAILSGRNASQLIVEKCQFGGCSGDVVIKADATRSLIVRDCDFIDYGTTGAFSQGIKTGNSAWIKAINPPPDTNSYGGYVEITNCRLDEGADKAIDIADYPRVKIEGVHINAALRMADVAVGIQLSGVAHARLENIWVGYQTGSDPIAAKFTNCGHVEIDGFHVGQDIRRILVDANTSLKIRNAPNVQIVRI